MEKLKVRKLFASDNTNALIIQAMDGKFYRFPPATSVPVRESALLPLPGFRPVGRNGREAPKYMYMTYGLEKWSDSIDDSVFENVVDRAMEQPDADKFVSEIGHPDWLEAMASEQRDAEKNLRDIHRAVHMSVREMVQASGMTQTKFANHFLIPLKTLSNWVCGQRECPLYLKLLMARDLGLFER